MASIESIVLQEEKATRAKSRECGGCWMIFVEFLVKKR